MAIAIILNSGLGSRMGSLTSSSPKCMLQISQEDTILSRQLKQLSLNGIKNVVITTGFYHEKIKEYCNSLDLDLNYTFVPNQLYDQTNYIYSIHLADQYIRNQGDVVLIHGDLVYDNEVLEKILATPYSSVVVSSTVGIPEKDFKAVIKENLDELEIGGQKYKTQAVNKIGIEFFDHVYASFPLYKFKQNDFSEWLDRIKTFCEHGNTNCYAEKALNEILAESKISLYTCDIYNAFCSEIDLIDDLNKVKEYMESLANKTVYLCFSTELLHNGHMELIKKARQLGKVIIGVLSDEAIATYKSFPLVNFAERKEMFSNIAGVYKVVKQEQLSYRDNLLKYRPDYVVHGDNWKTGYQKVIRDEVVETLASYGGILKEYPYSADPKYSMLEDRVRNGLSLPDLRRARLKQLISLKGCISAMEAHSGITGLIVENTKVMKDGQIRQFDAMWISSLCDSTSKGKPDIELVDMTSRFRTIDDIMEVTTKPIIFDGDTGGLVEHFVYTVKTLERMGVSMVIIEDKTGLKKNSLFGTEVSQTQDSIENFSRKIEAGKRAQKTDDFMICARIESLILEQGMEDALARAFAFSKAGADAIMIHSRKKDPTEIFEFVDKFREKNKDLPIVVVPTSFNTVTEEEFRKRGVNVVIYANQLTRSGFPAMQNAAKTILEHHRAKECDDLCMPIKDIITLIPEDL